MPHVALFITCLNDQFYPQVGVAVTKVLERLGCQVHFPTSQTCCGQPFFNNGYADEARALAKRMVEIFEPYPYIVTPSGSCCAMVREHYPELLGDDPAWETGMRKLVSNTYEFVEFLDKVLHVDFSQFSLSQPRTLTYHYNCHLRGLGVRDQAINLLKQIQGINFVPLEKADQCCGFGGTFAAKYPAISGAIVQDKVRCLAETKAQTVMCNDAGCTMNMSGLCHRQGVAIRFQHTAELLAEAMGIDLGQW